MLLDFFTEFEKKYSINELELLAVVWAIENFRNFVYETELKRTNFLNRKSQKNEWEKISTFFQPSFIF